MSAKSSGAAEPSASFRPTVALVLVVIGILATLLPAGVTGGAFLTVTSGSSSPTRPFLGQEFARHTRWVKSWDLPAVLLWRTAWALTTASLAVLPLWFWFWRRAGMTFARAIGVFVAATTALAICANAFCVTDESEGHRVGLPEGLFWLHVFAALLFAAAFLVAPAPVRPAAE